MKGKTFLFIMLFSMIFNSCNREMVADMLIWYIKTKSHGIYYLKAIYMELLVYLFLNEISVENQNYLK